MELKIDQGSGFVTDIVNRETGIHYKDPDDPGIWPFGLRLGIPQSPNLLRAEINAGKGAPHQAMTCELRNDGDGIVLEMVYDNLMTTGGKATGVGLKATILLRKDADYFVIRAHVRNNGPYEITRLYSGWGGLVADTAREKETLAVPDWSFGTKRRNPHATFPRRCTFGYPIMGSEGRMNAAWFDLYGEKGGIGTAYLNRQGLSMLFNVQSRGGGTAVNWQIFDLRFDAAAEEWFAVGDIYPLKPGESFCTDPWLLAPHAGDWHRMADIYRTEYERTFEGDYLTLETTHEVAKEVDLIAFWGWKAVNKDSFAEVPPAARAFIKRVGVAPENLMIPIVAFNHLPLRFPDHFPSHAAEGAPEACRAMVDELREMGVEAIPFFTHYYYNHPEAKDYTKEADTGYDHSNVLWGNIGNVACLDTDAWQKLWRESYIPGYERIGAGGVMLDEGEDQYVVCSHPEHRHGPTATGMLGAHVRGAREIIRAFREGFRERRPFFITEWAGDLVTRSVDIWSGFGGAPGDKMLFPPIVRRVEGWTIEREIFRYTWPYRLCTDSAFKNDYDAAWVNNALVNGMILGGYLSLSLTREIDDALCGAIRQFVRVRRELREARAPGFPHGFRDTIGLSVTEPGLVARVYRDRAGITLVYYAERDVDAAATVDHEALDCPPLNEATCRITLKKGQAGFTILR